MKEWVTRHKRTIAVPDRELNDVWFERNRQRVTTVPESAVVIGSNGPAIKNAVIASIRAAREMLVIGSFLIGSEEIVGAIEAAWKRGVRTYLLSASLEQLKTTQRALTDDDRKQVEAHQALLDRLARYAMIRAAPGFHAKFLLADPFDGGCGLLLTANLRDGAMQFNDEIAVPLDSDSASQLANTIRWSMWESSTHQMTEPGRLAAVAPLGQVPWKAPQGPLATTRWGDDITETALALLDDATTPVIATSFTWAPTSPVAARLCELARNGGDVTVLINPLVRSAVGAARAFKEAGCTVLGRDWMHAKALSVGGQQGLVHTLNFDDSEHDDSALDVGLLLSGTGASDLHRLLGHWASHAPYEFATSRKLSDAGDSVILTNGKPRRREIPATVKLDLGTVVAASADEMTATEHPAIPPDVYARTIEAQWTVEPPLLGAHASPVGPRPAHGKPGLYRDGNRLVVALDSIDSLPAARALKAQHNAAAIVLGRTSGKTRQRK